MWKVKDIFQRLEVSVKIKYVIYTTPFVILPTVFYMDNLISTLLLSSFISSIFTTSFKNSATVNTRYHIQDMDTFYRGPPLEVFLPIR